MPAYLVKPTCSVLVQGPHQIIECKIGANATAARMLPKACVIYDAVDGSVKEAAAASYQVIGVLMEAPDQTISTAYAVGDQCRVVTKGIVLCTFLSAATGCTPGDPLATVGSSGGVGAVASASAACIIGKALSTVASGGAATDVIVELF